MLGWAITFLIVALVSAILGFGGIAVFAVDIARIIFVVAIILFVISAVVALIRGQSRSTIANQTVSRLRPLTIMCWRNSPSNENPSRSAAFFEGSFASLHFHSKRL